MCVQCAHSVCEVCGKSVGTGWALGGEWVASGLAVCVQGVCSVWAMHQVCNEMADCAACAGGHKTSNLSSAGRVLNLHPPDAIAAPLGRRMTLRTVNNVEI